MWKFVLISLFTVLLVWVWKVLHWVWLEPKRLERFLRKQGFKGNSYNLLFGDMKEIGRMYKEAHSKPIGLHDDIIPRVMPFIVNTINKYGKNSFAWIGPSPRVYISDAELMREVLTKHTSFQKNFKVTNKILKLMVGGLVEFEEAKWTRHRTKLNPAFHLEKLKNMCPVLQTSSESILNDWKKKMKDGSGVVDVFHYLEAYTAAAVTAGLFTHPFDAEMIKCFRILRELSLMANASVKFEFPGQRFLPTRLHMKAQEMEADLRWSYKKMINERIKKRREGKDDGRDLFDLFLDELYDENKAKELDVEGVVDDAVGNCKLFFFAGHETTSNLLVWTMVNLAIHQDWQTRAREEVFRILGDRKDITSDDLSQMKIVNMIVHEVLRLFPPVVELSRVVEKDTKLGNDLIIPKGIQIQLPVGILHRKPEIWGEDAAIFNPERFSQGVMKATNGIAAFLPFGWGPRICIGQNFVIMESKVFLAALLMKFTWQLSPEYTHAPYAPFTVQPQYGAPMLLHEI